MTCVTTSGGPWRTTEKTLGKQRNAETAGRTSSHLAQWNPLKWHATTRVKHPPGLPNCGSDDSGIVAWCAWLWRWGWWTEMNESTLRKIPRGFVPKQNSWPKWSSILTITLKHLHVHKQVRTVEYIRVHTPKKAARVWEKGRAQKSCKGYLM